MAVAPLALFVTALSAFMLSPSLCYSVASPSAAPSKCSFFSTLLEQTPQITHHLRHFFLSEIIKDQQAICNAGICQHRLWLPILRHLAPFLETLSFIYGCWVHDDVEQNIFSTSFPRLRELTVKTGRGIQFPIPFPSLDRLHLYTPCAAGRVLDYLAHICPRLTHFKVTSLTFGSRLLCKRLKEVRSTPPGSSHVMEDAYGPFFHLPPFLCCIILQPGRIPPASQWRPAVVAHLKSLKNDLIDLANSDLAHGLVIEEDMARDRFDEKIISDWLDRLDGGEGCWAVKELAQLSDMSSKRLIKH